MNHNLDIEVLEQMEKHSISYDEALEKIQRKKAQLELAGERFRAQTIKKSVTKKKQKDMKEALEHLATE